MPKFVYALDGEPESLDCATAASTRSERVCWLVFDTLVKISDHGQALEQWLVDEPPLDPNALKVLFRLRPNVKFHDGHVLNAQAVKDNFERYYNDTHSLYVRPKSGHSTLGIKGAFLKQLIKRITLDPNDDLKLEFEFNFPGLHYLAEIDIHSPIAIQKAKVAGQEYGSRAAASNGHPPTGSGPFKFKSWSSGQIVLEAFRNYWRGGPQHITEVDFRIIPGGIPREDALKGGDVHFDPVVADPESRSRIHGGEAELLGPVDHLGFFYLGFNTELPKGLSDEERSKIRKAVAYGINVQSLTGNIGVPAKGPLPPPIEGHDSRFRQVEHNERAARDLLGAGGYPLRLLYNGSDVCLAAMATDIQQALKKLGMTVNPLPKPSFAELVEAIRAQEGEMFIYSWHIRAPFPERILFPLFHSDGIGTTNLTRYRAVDALLLNFLRSRSRADLDAILERIFEDVPMVFLFCPRTRTAAVNRRVKGLALRNYDAAPKDKLVGVNVT